MGRVNTARKPASVTITEITAAKIGRSMKNFAISQNAPETIGLTSQCGE